jgi:predicted restriction endonuclease
MVVAVDWEVKLKQFLGSQPQLYGASRSGQTKYRKALFNLWGGTCAITGCDQPQMLVASHIKPFAECAPKERYDVYNGFLLSADWDRLFDNFLISFSDEGSILYTDKVTEFVKEQWWKRMSLGEFALPALLPQHLPYLAYHRKKAGFPE